MICNGCGEDKKIKARGLCDACYSRQWRENNPIQFKVIQKRYRDANKDKIKKYAKDNPDIMKKSQRKYYLKNIDKIKEYQNKRYHEMKDGGLL